MNPLFPGQNFAPVAAPYASLNGATYLAPYILSSNPAIVSLDINWYVPETKQINLARCTDLTDAPSRGFRSRYLWDSNGNKTTGATYGQRYLLSTMLAVTHGRGNSVEEALNYLRRAVAADGTHPKGTIYFMWNKDVRSTTRDKCFPAIAAKINAAGARAVVQQGVLPTGAKDVAGMMVGASDFDLAKDGIQILPGAICEHLTSAGGILETTDFQTPLSEFLRHGAAGASGTVVEPLAVQAKFPLASIQLHYVRGCSLAEAFYQSVSGPYQLLIVGDPLCQPWANAPTVNVTGVKPEDRVKGTLSITPFSTGPIRAYELFVDGHLATRTPAGNAIPLDTTQLADGHHELRVVGTRSDAIETQGRRIVPIVVNNHDAAVDLKISPGSRVGLLATLKLSVHQPGASAIAIRQNNRELARVQGESGDVEIPAATLGAAQPRCKHLARARRWPYPRLSRLSWNDKNGWHILINSHRLATAQPKTHTGSGGNGGPLPPAGSNRHDFEESQPFLSHFRTIMTDARQESRTARLTSLTPSAVQIR